MFEVKCSTCFVALQIHPGPFDKELCEGRAVGFDSGRGSFGEVEKTELGHGKGLMTQIIKSLLRFMCSFTDLIYTVSWPD